MSLKVIEFNDAALKVGDASGILLQSPGFALARDKNLILGEMAEQQARLHPTHSYNKYWHELSLDPLSRGHGIRHFADIAYAQLLHLAEHARIEGDVLFAVPGNFTRQQLAILLGLAQQCPFTPIGVVDSALAAAIANADLISNHNTGTMVYAELQLHQVLLTRLKVANEQLTIDSVVQVPGVGSQNFMDLMMQMATSAFIQQCRFNPQHNAESEQQLYNALPHWWRQQVQLEGSLVLELRVGNTVHTAKMPRESLISSLSGHFQKIGQQVTALAPADNSSVLLGASLATLPGLANLLSAERIVQTVEVESISNACLAHHEHIRSADQGIRLTTTLPVRAKTTTQDQTAKPSTPAVSAQPTHVLYHNKAIPLGSVKITNSVDINGHAPAHTIQLSLAGLPEELGQISVSEKSCFFDSGKQEFLLNQKQVSGKQKLTLGDRIQFSSDSEALTLIQVN